MERNGQAKSIAEAHGVRTKKCNVLLRMANNAQNSFNSLHNEKKSFTAQSVS